MPYEIVAVVFYSLVVRFGSLRSLLYTELIRILPQKGGTKAPV